MMRLGKTVQQARTFLGHEYSFIGFNELTKQHNPAVYDEMTGTQRTGYTGELGRLKTRVLSTTNPWGLGRRWVYDRFMKPNNDRYGIPIIRPYNVPIMDEKTRAISLRKVNKTLLAIMGTMLENPYFTPEDRANLMMGLENDPAKWKAYMECDWHALSGEGALDDIFDYDIHVVDNFPIPKDWACYRAFDYGSSHPFAYGILAVSNGEDVKWHDKIYCFPKGSMILCAELYGGITDIDGNQVNEGVRWPPKQIAEAIRELEENYRKAYFIHPRGDIFSGPADSQIWHNRGRDAPPIASIFEESGVHFIPASKGHGSRSAGLSLLRDVLWRSRNNEPNGLYIMKRCDNTLRTVPYMERHELKEDIADGQEDHLYDMLRYAVMDREETIPEYEVSYAF